jgi:hypothetical protein
LAAEVAADEFCRAQAVQVVVVLMGVAVAVQAAAGAAVMRLLVVQEVAQMLRAVLVAHLTLAAVADGEHPVEQQVLALVGLAEEPLR